MKQLTKSQLERSVPSAFATAPASTVSNKYLFVPTTSIIKTLEEYGWLPVAANESAIKADKNVGVQRHMIKFENSDMSAESWGGSLQFIIINGHNARTSLKGYIGYDVFVCSNGVVSGEIEDSFKISHKIENFDFIKDALGNMFNQAQSKKQVIEDARSIVLTKNEKGVFAYQAHSLRYKKDALVRPEDLLTVRRPEDDNNTLWSTFNVIQENLIKGGIEYKMYNDRSEYNDISRPVTQIDKNLKINIGLWQMMQQFRGSK